MFADKLAERDNTVRKLLEDTRMVRIHEDVVEQVVPLVYKEKDKLHRLSKYVCWPDKDTWLEWEETTSEGQLRYGFLFHGDEGKSVLTGTGMFFLDQSTHGNPITIPVRYDLESYKLYAYDVTTAVQAKLAKMARADPRRQWFMDKLARNGQEMIDPILLSVQTKPLLDTLKPILFGLLAFMNSPKLIRTREVDVSRLNARRLKRGKYPYHPHHEVRLNIDKHAFKITQGQGDGPERCLHFVRAHLRFLVHPRYKNVSVVLVPPHYRGNPELGITNTSYAVDRQNSRWNN